MTIKEFFKQNQQGIVTLIGYLAAAGLGFGLGQMTTLSKDLPEIKVEQAFAPLNNTPNTADNQPSEAGGGGIPTVIPTESECPGQIKGNIGSSGKVYHIPGSSSYNRTDPEECFNTEAEAQAAGFRKAGSTNN